MDCFDSRYYSLNRKILLFLGQWPYQNYAERVRIWAIYFSLLVTAFIVQIGRAVKADKVDFDLAIEFISLTLVGTVTVIRYFTFTVYNGKIRRFLDNIKIDWQRITNQNEYQILCNSAEASRSFLLVYTTLGAVGMLIFSITMLSSPLLIYTPYFNESCPVLMMYSKEYIVDPQKYCLPLLMHICIVIGTLMLGIVGTDTMYMAILYHVVAMFKIVCYRLEHAFDQCTEESKYTSDRTNVYEKIASAVEYHKTAIRFGEDVGETFQWANMISLMLTLLSIAVVLYWAAMSKGQGFKPFFAMVICGAVMMHLFFMDLPSQRMIDNSEAVIFKAYCGMWYMAPAKEQTLLLLTMQRGIKPTVVVMGKLHAATLENFAAEVQASFSYFTLLMSMQ